MTRKRGHIGYRTILAEDVRPHHILLIKSKEIHVESVRFDGANIIINEELKKRPKSQITRENTWQEYSQSQFIPSFMQQPMATTTQSDLERESAKKSFKLIKQSPSFSEWI